MKKILLTISAAGLLALNAHSQIIFQDNFSSVTPTIISSGSQAISSSDTGKWLGVFVAGTNSTVVNSGFGTLGIQTNTNNRNTRGAAYILGDGYSGLVAGSYTLTIDLSAMFSDTIFDAYVFTGNSSGGPTNTYGLTLNGGGGTQLSTLQTGFFGTGTPLTQLGSGFINNTTAFQSSGAVAKSLSVNFTYGGTGDIVLLFDSRTNQSTVFPKQSTMTNVTLAVPEPGTMGLLGLGVAGLAFVGWRRKW
jgi:hypothetical protein